MLHSYTYVRICATQEADRSRSGRVSRGLLERALARSDVLALLSSRERDLLCKCFGCQHIGSDEVTLYIYISYYFTTMRIVGIYTIGIEPDHRVYKYTTSSRHHYITLNSIYDYII